MLNTKAKYSTFILSLCIFLCSCTGRVEPSTTVPTETFLFSPPSCNENTNSDSVTASPTKEHYLPTDQIDIIVTGANTSDNKLYLYHFVGVERLDDGVWISMPFLLSSLEPIANGDGFYWQLLSRADSDTMWTTMTLDTKNLAQPLTVGQYRAVIYLPDTQLYAYFEIVE